MSGAKAIRTSVVRDILLAHWDPLGVRGKKNDEDLYDPYIPDIIHLLQAHVTPQELAVHLAKLLTETLYATVEERRTAQVATLLVEVGHTEMHR